MKTYQLENLDCAGCAREIQTLLNERDDVDIALVDFPSKTLKLDSSDHVAAIGALTAAHPEIRAKESTETSRVAKRGRAEAAPLIVSAALMAAGLSFVALSGALGMPDSVRLALEIALFASAWLVAGYRVALDGVKSILTRISLDENFLMTVASLGAFAIGEYAEGAAVMVFYKLGEVLEAKALRSSRASIESLLAMRPDFARLLAGGAETLVPADEVAAGNLLRVLPGERVPVDCVIERGEGLVDSSSMTGESMPREVAAGSELYSGFLSIDAALDVRATAIAAESGVRRVAAMVERAAAAKTRTESFISAFAKWYTPLVVGGAALLALLPPLLFPGQDWYEWTRRALTMLVISCPCALVVSVPLAYFGGIGGAARRGILVRDATALDALAKATTIAFDKTGTLTEGRFEVTLVEPAHGVDPDTLLAAAAAAESRSNHPIALAIRRAADHAADRSRHSSFQGQDGEFREEGGFGVTATIGGERFLVGTPRLLEREGPIDGFVHSAHAHEVGGTIALVARSGSYLGAIRLADRPKNDAATAIAELERLGVGDMVMLTGDSREAANDIASSIGINRVEAGLLPGHKVAALEAIMHTPGHKVAFVGDGINDAPSLARADVGIAMGSGAAAACEAADIVIAGGSPSSIPEAIRRSRKTVRIVAQNVVFALAVKAIFLSMGSFGLADMWEAVIADVGVTLLAVLNSLRALR